MPKGATKPWLEKVFCKDLQKNGQPCTMPRMKGSDFCINHNPEVGRKKRMEKITECRRKHCDPVTHDGGGNGDEKLTEIEMLTKMIRSNAARRIWARPGYKEKMGTILSKSYNKHREKYNTEAQRVAQRAGWSKHKRRVQRLADELKEVFVPGKWLPLGREDFMPVKRYLTFRGVYAICSADEEEEILYIGSTQDIGSRAGGRWFEALEGKEIDWIIKIRRNRKKFEDLRLEAYLISRIRPIFNQQFNTYNDSGF